MTIKNQKSVHVSLHAIVRFFIFCHVPLFTRSSAPRQEEVASLLILALSHAWDLNIQHLPTLESHISSVLLWCGSPHGRFIQIHLSLARIRRRQPLRWRLISFRASSWFAFRKPSARGRGGGRGAGRCSACSGVLSLEYWTWRVPSTLCLDITHFKK